MSVNSDFADIVHNSLYDVDELCDDIFTRRRKYYNLECFTTKCHH